MICRIQKRVNPYVMIDRAAVDDDRLSWKARGLHTYLMSRPDTWVVRVSHLVAQGPDGERAVRSALMELRKYGYAEIIYRRDSSGKMAGREWVIYEVPTVNGADERDVDNLDGAGEGNQETSDDIDENQPFSEDSPTRTFRRRRQKCERRESADVGGFATHSNKQIRNSNSLENNNSKGDSERRLSVQSPMRASGNGAASESEGKDVVVAFEMIELLVSRGIDHEVAERLVEDYGSERVKQQVAHFDYRRRKNDVGPGWLRRAIEQNYVIPPGVSKKTPKMAARTFQYELGDWVVLCATGEKVKVVNRFAVAKGNIYRVNNKELKEADVWEHEIRREKVE